MVSYINCDICKFNNNCEAKAKALWVYGEGRNITGCNKGEPDKIKIRKKIKLLKELLNEK